MPFSGVISAMITPFTEDGEKVHGDSLAALVEQGIADGISGFVPCGGTGEFPALSEDERRAVIEATCSQVAGRVKVVAQVGAPSTRAAVANARHAEQSGADAIMVATPYYEPLDLDGAFRYLEKVAESTSLPICVYNHPPAMGVTWGRESLARIKDLIPTVEIVKDSSGDFASLTSLLLDPIPGVDVFVGEDILVPPAFLTGKAGAIVGAANFLTPGFAALQRAAEAGDAARAYEIWHGILPLINAVISGPYNGAVKAVCGILGLQVGPIREPYLSLVPSEVDALKAVVEATDPAYLSDFRKAAA
ncbi:dihydrodipicolinate synthase family protein [Amycolatopsis acidicola]|uniref:Dihydrodipicolinate synthase family protein n=1 Tax=Amycolatopsis acidicola TaxID=2596893 RepID=A0A5N0VFW7_9PSEU|nr:dihydrodipicolinate synthase family protein [Amycolatopsis acidicola]KAA9164030.1 dihydrodipicolinate synthase family protein [Amycolatopsis acidicola]